MIAGRHYIIGPHFVGDDVLTRWVSILNLLVPLF